MALDDPVIIRASYWLVCMHGFNYMLLLLVDLALHQVLVVADACESTTVALPGFV